MGITLTRTQLIPTNVVEVGNELSQNVLNGLAASGISQSNPATTMAWLAGTRSKPVKSANDCPFDYALFKQNYASEILISVNGTNFYIPSR
jgi:hypothetical protein